MIRFDNELGQWVDDTPIAAYAVESIEYVRQQLLPRASSYALTGNEADSGSGGGVYVHQGSNGNDWTVYGNLLYEFVPGSAPSYALNAFRKATPQEMERMFISELGSGWAEIAMGVAFVFAPYAIALLTPTLGALGAQMAVGAGKALITGGNPLTGAITGGAGGFVSDSLFGGSIPGTETADFVGDLPTVFDAPNTSIYNDFSIGDNFIGDLPLASDLENAWNNLGLTDDQIALYINSGYTPESAATFQDWRDLGLPDSQITQLISEGYPNAAAYAVAVEWHELGLSDSQIANYINNGYTPESAATYIYNQNVIFTAQAVEIGTATNEASAIAAINAGGGAGMTFEITGPQTPALITVTDIAEDLTLLNNYVGDFPLATDVSNYVGDLPLATDVSGASLELPLVDDWNFTSQTAPAASGSSLINAATIGTAAAVATAAAAVSNATGNVGVSSANDWTDIPPAFNAQGTPNTSALSLSDYLPSGETIKNFLPSLDTVAKLATAAMPFLTMQAGLTSSAINPLTGRPYGAINPLTGTPYTTLPTTINPLTGFPYTPSELQALGIDPATGMPLANGALTADTKRNLLYAAAGLATLAVITGGKGNERNKRRTRKKANERNS